MTSMQTHVDTAIETLQNRLSKSSNVGLLWTGGKEAQVLSHMISTYTDHDVPHLVIDTGNQYEEMYDFRERYVDEYDIDVIVEKNSELLESVIENEDDPRGYHGSWDDDGDLPDDLSGMSAQNTDPDSWGVAESCGALKIVPMKYFIRDHGFDTLISGERRDDPMVGGSDPDDVEHVESESAPLDHQRVRPLLDWGHKQTWAYIKREFVPYPSLYDSGMTHTDSICCTDEQSQINEYGAGGVDAELESQKDNLADLGYV